MDMHHPSKNGALHEMKDAQPTQNPLLFAMLTARVADFY
jgi:hypothetical protein